MTTYPNSVRTFTPKQDATTFVLAAHINDLQDEVAAIERIVGTMPQQWDNSGTMVFLYGSVKSRLDDIQNTAATMQQQIADIITQLQQIGPLTSRVSALEAFQATANAQITALNNVISQMRAQLIDHESRITALEGNTGGVPALLAGLQSQINALQSGQVAYIHNTGQVVVPDTYQWRTLNWNSAPVDNAGIFLGGSNLICPQDGWWIVNLMGVMENTRSGIGSPTQCLANLALRIDGSDVASTSEELELGIGGFFRMNIPWAGPWYRGSAMTAAINFNPWSGSNPSISARISFTRMHNL